MMMTIYLSGHFLFYWLGFIHMRAAPTAMSSAPFIYYFLVGKKSDGQ